MNILFGVLKTVFISVWITFDLAIILFNSAIWIRLSPPASALLTLPKMIYPNLVNKAIYGYFGLALVMITVVVLAQLKVISIRMQTSLLLYLSLAILAAVTISSDLYINKLKEARIEYANPAMQDVPGANVHFDLDYRSVIDLKDRFVSIGVSPAVFKLYLPEPKVVKRDVVIYLAYGNWNAAPESIADYFVDAMNEKGYAAVVLTGQTRRETDFIGMVKDIKEKVAFLRDNSDELGVGRIFLSGGSAGANLALTTAYSQSIQEFQVAGLAEEQTKVDGVIAFYPVVDMVYNYHFYTDKTEEQMDLFDRLGDWLFSLSDPNKAKSISESHKKVMDTLLGGFPDHENMERIYQISSPISLVDEKAPPTLLIHGTHDSMTPIEPTREMCGKLKNAGADVALLELPFTDHAFDAIAPRESLVTEKAMDSVLEWLSHLQP